MKMRLCGGTFFTLLTTVKREATRRRARFMGEEAAICESDMLVALMKILNPDHRVYAGDLKAIVSKYKACRYGGGTNIPLGDPRYTFVFQRRLQSEYPSVLRNMKEFCEVFLEAENPGKMEWLCRALMAVIASDGDIDREYPAYVNPDGSASCLRRVPEMKRICLPALLTGIWGYIAMKVPDNAVGLETIREWTKDKEFKNGWNAVSMELGSEPERKIEVTLEIPRTDQPQGPAAQRRFATDPDPAGDSAMNQDRAPQRRFATDQDPAASHGSRTPSFFSAPPAPQPLHQPGSRGGESLPVDQSASWGAGSLPVDQTASWGAGSPPVVYAGVQVMGQMSGNIYIQGMREPAFHGWEPAFTGQGSAAFSAREPAFPVQGTAAFPALELSALDKGLYSLFVMEGEVFPGGSFTMPMDRSISAYIDPAIRREFLPMTAMEIARLTRMPSLFATPNHAWNTTEEEHQIILGRVTGILLQKQGVRFDWKPYCYFPQERLNEHEELFDLCCSEANNELSEEHWTIKKAPLLSILRSLGLDPWERMNPGRMAG